ncbi:MAG: acyltransferase, partial [Clostridium sp.]|nr:acyltransferase [Clostridium sp.]
MSATSFRAEINGLRAIAVVSVVLFHFGIAGFSGGFVGVDIFFVISGFLMTSIVIRGLGKKNFSFISFYLARARRIIPALFFLAIVLLIVGWFYLSPDDYLNLAKEVDRSLLFLSNNYFFKHSGYFDPDSHERLLLHTWSLSVEWQFYILYPILLFFISKFSIK